MSLDISHILKEWPYRPGQVTARRIRGRDGCEKIQLRLDLGLLQMEASGRPDGERPHGFESLLAYHEHRLQRHRDQRGDEEGFGLDEADCELLRNEGTTYYHRYVAEFVLGDYEAVERDAMRNLRLMDFCKQYAREESDRYLLEQYRPYVLMMCARARGQIALRDSRPKAALHTVRKAIREIEAFYESFGGKKMMSHSGELAVLRAMEKEIEAKVPADPLEKLHQELAEAVEAEQYERAAEIRDKIRRASGQ
jgi:hypothetical protein